MLRDFPLLLKLQQSEIPLKDIEVFKPKRDDLVVNKKSPVHNIKTPYAKLYAILIL